MGAWRVLQPAVKTYVLFSQIGKGRGSLTHIDDAGLKAFTLLESKDFTDVLGPRVLHGKLILCRKRLKKDDIHTGEYSIVMGLEGRVGT
jgi:hypothetical protein